jgi:receptor protein-tyrosine kinase
MIASMSSEPEAIDPPSRISTDEELSRTLVQLNRLSEDTAEQINDLMRSLHIRFAEAALQLGALSQAELDDAQEWMNREGLGRPQGLIEEVLRRTAGKRDTILWERDQLEPSAGIILVHQPDHPHCESVRSLRTELLLRCKGRRGAGIMAILSPCDGEGRSLLAAELAIAFAQLERRTLLVDADLRKPSQHRLFGADNDMGLAQALTNGGPHHFHGVKGLPEMTLMTSGEVPQNALELLSGRPFERAMAQWRRSFEFVILDTPPTTQYSDALAIASAAGNVLMLGRAESTRFSDLNEICRNLSSTQSHIHGAVINRF